MKNLAENVRAQISEAFRGVKLGEGVSLKQADVINTYNSAGLNEREFDALKNSEVVSDWQAIPRDQIANFECIAHLDAAGLRYYLPALMLRLLEEYYPSMRVIGTIQALYPKKDFWAYHMERYKLLSIEQKRAIACFMQALPKIISLDEDDGKAIERGLRNYWCEFLPRHGD